MNKQGWYISFKRKDNSSFEDDGSSLRSSIRFHPFSWRIHHGMIPFFTWTTKTHSPSNSNWWGGELHQVLRSYWSGPTKAMITLDCRWCWCRIQSPWCSFLFFLEASVEIFRLGCSSRMETVKFWKHTKNLHFLQRSGTNMTQNLWSWGYWNPYSRLTSCKNPPRHLTSPGETLLLARRSCAKQEQHFKNLC